MQLTRQMVVTSAILLVLAGCAKDKPKPLVPLALDARASQQAITLTEQGTVAYQARQFDEAKSYFERALTAAPKLGATHYNLGLALNAVGDAQAAHDQFLEAATLEPGNRVIWDSPALHPYGNPEVEKRARDPRYSTSRPGLGAPPPR